MQKRQNIFRQRRSCASHTCKNTAKKRGKRTLARTRQVKKEKVEMSLELTKTRLRLGFESATCNQELLSLTHYLLSHASLTTDKH